MTLRAFISYVEAPADADDPAGNAPGTHRRGAAGRRGAPRDWSERRRRCAGNRKERLTDMKLNVAGRVSLYAVVASAVLSAGCAAERPESVPADARSVAKQAGNNPVNFTAPHDGMVYVYDRSAQKMVYSGRVQRGETLELDPRRDNVRLDGRTVLEKDLRDLNEYQVWFDEEAARTAGDPSR